MISQIRSTGRYAWHGGDWGTIIGVEVREISKSSRVVERRPCYLILFPDGTTDAWMIYDPDAKYEFRNVVPGTPPSRMIWEERLIDGSSV